MVRRFRSRLSRLSGLVLTAAAAASLAAACSSKPPSSFGDGPDAGGTGDDTSGNDDTFDPGGDDDGGGSLDSDGGGSVTNPAVVLDGGCAQSTSRGQTQPLDMYIMLDQSGSMNQDNKWPAVTAALTSFVNQTTLAGVGVGIQYFGLPPGGGSSGPACPTTCAQNSDCGGSGTCLFNVCICVNFADSCNAADYAKPELEIAPLPGAAKPIIASMAQHGPSSGTPTSAALQGAVDHASAWAKAHKGHTTIVLLATDGDPSGCDTNLANIDAIAQKAYAATPSVRTYVIGVGNSLTALNGIAAAGGSSSAFVVDTSQNTTAQFLAAMNKIRGAALGCTYTIPKPDAGTANFSQVNVSYDPGTGKSVVMPKASSKAACPTATNAWYYDDNNNPTSIILCDSTCGRVSSITSATLSVVTGCATQTIN